MELRDYARILFRFWWLIIALPVVVGAASFVMRPPSAPVYAASVRFTIGVNALAPEKATGYDPILTAYQASEYIRDDFVEIVQSDVFADDVNAVLAKTGANEIKIRKGNISAAIEKQRRLMSMSVTWGDAAQAQKIADAAVKNLGENNSKYFAQLGSSGATLVVIDKPVVTAISKSLREQLDIPIRVVIALVAALALAFIFDYLDTSVRDARDAEQLGLRIIGEIPRAK